jgi:hypothetical protein
MNELSIWLQIKSICINNVPTVNVRFCFIEKDKVGKKLRLSPAMGLRDRCYDGKFTKTQT